MSYMVEKVARALARCLHGLGDSEKENQLAVDYHWHKYAVEARAAIEAMREPTPEMLSVGIGGAEGVKRRLWHLMTDAALKGEAE